MRWIKHDVDANQDAKLQNVLLDYGLEGYGLYWYCIELIAGKVSPENITFELEHDARIIARNVGSTAQKVEEMMRYFVELGLFEDSEGTITCIKIATRLNKSMTSNPEMRAIIGMLKNHDPVMTKSPTVMKDKIRLDKSKEPSQSKIAEKETIPVKEIVEAYNEICTNMPEAKTISQKQKRIIWLKARWREQDKADQNLDWWRGYFKWCNEHPQLTGQQEGFNWIASLEDLVNASKFQRLIEKGSL